VFLQSDDLICSSSAIALESRLSLIRRREHTGISDFGQTRRPLGSVFSTASRTRSLRNLNSNLREYRDALISKAGFAVESILWVEQKNYEMNKCLSLVHLTSTVRPQSSDSDKPTSLFLRRQNLLPGQRRTRSWQPDPITNSHLRIQCCAAR
jgi:hypothetical protein